jgi:hypothetical protein
MSPIRSLQDLNLSTVILSNWPLSAIAGVNKVIMELGIPELVGRAGGEEQAQSVGIVKEVHEPQRQFSCSSKPTQSLDLPA